jgi:hypothetical protein
MTAPALFIAVMASSTSGRHDRSAEEIPCDADARALTGSRNRA